MAEQAYQRLMLLFQRLGRHSEALKVYRELTHRLAEELDTLPDAATKRVYEEIATRKAQRA